MSDLGSCVRKRYYLEIDYLKQRGSAAVSDLNSNLSVYRNHKLFSWGFVKCCQLMASTSTKKSHIINHKRFDSKYSKCEAIL